MFGEISKLTYYLYEWHTNLGLSLSNTLLTYNLGHSSSELKMWYKPDMYNKKVIVSIFKVFPPQKILQYVSKGVQIRSPYKITYYEQYQAV